MPDNSSEVTELLRQWSGGDPEALDRLMPLVIDEVRTLARKALSLESPTHTLQPTALVNEVYLRLIDRKTYWWKDRVQFFSCLANLMRRILVDHARRQRAAKRGGGEKNLSLEEAIVPAQERDTDLVALDDALRSFEVIDPKRHQVVMLWYFMGLTQDEIASELGISVNTVRRWLDVARLWLQREMLRVETDKADDDAAGGGGTEGDEKEDVAGNDADSDSEPEDDSEPKDDA